MLRFPQAGSVQHAPKRPQGRTVDRYQLQDAVELTGEIMVRPPPCVAHRM